MKMMHGAFSRALLNTSRTMRGPSPSHLRITVPSLAYFCTNSLATT